MTLEQTKQDILFQISTCFKWSHFEGIDKMVKSGILNKKAEFGVDACEEAEHEITIAVKRRIIELGLNNDDIIPAQRKPSCDEFIDGDSAFEGAYMEPQPTDIIN